MLAERSLALHFRGRVCYSYRLVLIDILPRITEDSAAPSYCACEVAEDVLEETQNIVAEPPIDNSVISCFPEKTLWYDVQVS